mgnify:CR=1 FL=1
MKNKKRSFRLLTVALCILMFLSVVPLTAFAATYSGTCGDSGDNITWELDEAGVLTLKGSGDMASYYYSGEIPWNELGITNDIKSIIVGEGITSIGSYAFYYCKNAVSVSIPSTVTKIGTYSFYSTGITEITIPESVTEISKNAFSYSNKLVKVTLPSSLTKLADSVFNGCSSLTTVNIPKSLTSVGSYALSGTAIESIVLPETVTELGDGAFSRCTKLTSVNIPEGITEIGMFTFNDCEALTSLHIPASVEKMYADVFEGCISLKTLTVDEENQYFKSVDDVIYNKDMTTLILYAPKKENTSFSVPATVKTIDAYAFQSAGLKTVTLPDELNEIGYAAFIKSSIESIIIPASVTKLGSLVFSKCNSLTSVVFEDGITIKEIPYSAFSSSSAIESIEIPESVEIIESIAFAYCTKLKNVSISDKITQVGNDAFKSTALLKSMSYSNGVKYLDGWAVDLKYGVENIVIKEGTKGLADGFFNFDSVIKTISLPASLQYVGEQSFLSSENIVSVTVADNNNYYSSLDGILYNKEKTELIYYPKGKTDESFTAPSTVKVIYDCAFYQSSVKNVVLPEGLEKIGNSAFWSNKALESINFPSTLLDVGDTAFEYCSVLDGIALPDGITHIGVSAFYNTKYYDDRNNWTDYGNVLINNGWLLQMYTDSLVSTTLTIAEGIKGLADNVFTYTNINQFTAISLPKSLKYVGESALQSLYLATDIYYASSKDDFEKIEIGNRNTVFDTATLHYTTIIDVIEISDATLSFKAGDTPVFTGTVPESAPYYIDHEGWDGSDGTGYTSSDYWNSRYDGTEGSFGTLITEFKDGVTYTYRVYFKLTAEGYNAGYRFDKDITKLKLNGRIIDLSADSIGISDAPDNDTAWFSNVLITTTDLAKVTDGDVKVRRNKQNSAKYDLGFTGEFKKADFDVKFSEDGRSENLMNVGVSVTINGKTLEFEDRFVYVDSDGNYKFRAVLAGLEENMLNTEIRVKMFIVFNDGTRTVKYYSDGITTALGEHIGRTPKNA